MIDRTLAPYGTRQEQILRDLLEARGFVEGTYALFFTSDEGRLLPISTPEEDVEELSGYLVDRAGRHYLFWLGWDDQTQSPALTRWGSVEPQPQWSQSPEYREALKEVGRDIR